MPNPTPLSEVLRNLAEFIVMRAVPQGPYHVVRGNAVRELERLTGCVLEAALGAGLQPSLAENAKQDRPLELAIREASRLHRQANAAFSGCIDVRLESSPERLHELLGRAARESARKTGDPKQPVARGRKESRQVPAKPGRTARDSKAPPPSRNVPKHVELMGKAAKLCELIRVEREANVGRTITNMCESVGVSRETFQTSKHFEAARLAWSVLKRTRDSQHERKRKA